MDSKTLAVGLTVLAIGALLALPPVWAAAAGCGGCGGCGSSPRVATSAVSTAAPACPVCQVKSSQKKHVTAALEALGAAKKAADAGDAKTASAQIAKAQTHLGLVQKEITEKCSLCAADDGKIVNVRCPIMGSKVNPDKISSKLIREFEGQKVGFCCGGCPAAWDKLSDAARDEKLRAVLAPGSEGH